MYPSKHRNNRVFLCLLRYFLIYIWTQICVFSKTLEMWLLPCTVRGMRADFCPSLLFRHKMKERWWPLYWFEVMCFHHWKPDPFLWWVFLCSFQSWMFSIFEGSRICDPGCLGTPESSCVSHVLYSSAFATHLQRKHILLMMSYISICLSQLPNVFGFVS